MIYTKLRALQTEVLLALYKMTDEYKKDSVEI